MQTSNQTFEAAPDPKFLLDSLRTAATDTTKGTSPEMVYDTAIGRGKIASEIMSRWPDRVEQAVRNAGTNNIDAPLKRVMILGQAVRAFARRLILLQSFSTVFSDVPLQGTDEVVVPYFPLQNSDSKNWSPDDGYVFDVDSNSQSKKITVNKRKYQPLDYSSAEFRRQPYFNSVRLGEINAEKLAYDSLCDILSLVKRDKFPNKSLSWDPREMDSDSVGTIRSGVNRLHWPDMGRSLIANADVDDALMKDPAYKLALNIGGTEVIREGKMPEKISGFTYLWMSGLPGNEENLTAFAAYQSAILTAFSPVEPADGVRHVLVAYDVLSDPQTGISLNYRKWGNADFDRNKEVIETAYGYEAGEANAIQRVTSVPEF